VVALIEESDTGYVHSIIPNYGKLTGDVCNLQYFEKLFSSRAVLSLMERLSVPGTEDYHHFTDRYYIVVMCWPNNWTIKNVKYTVGF
jgi:hypothetical protein